MKLASTSRTRSASRGIAQTPKHSRRSKGPRILFVTPEIASVPAALGEGAESIHAKAGGMADVSALLLEDLVADNADIHLALPHYRKLFQKPDQSRSYYNNPRIHLAEDSSFYRCPSAYYGDSDHLRGSSLAFQREVINHIIPKVQPDIVHCNDWMTGLIPAACKKMGIPTLFTIHNIHSERSTLAEIEQRGIDASEFWDLLYYEDYPGSFDEAYHHNPVNLLHSAILNADFINTVSPTFLDEIITGIHGHLPDQVRHELGMKQHHGYAKGILNAPPQSYQPTSDPALEENYSSSNHQPSKAFNKLSLQKLLKLREDPEAPLLFWPSRLDPLQKGCHLFTDILYRIISDYAHLNLQVVVVGEGSFQGHFHDIVAKHELRDRVAVCDFYEDLSRQCFAASDFVLLPSSFEPCGLPQMIGARYGSLPIVHCTGGLKDTVTHFNQDYTHGNGFVFEYFDSHGLAWAISKALDFYQLPSAERKTAISRVMDEAEEQFGTDAMYAEYKDIYQTLTHTKSISNK